MNQQIIFDISRPIFTLQRIQILLRVSEKQSNENITTGQTGSLLIQTQCYCLRLKTRNHRFRVMKEKLIKYCKKSSKTVPIFLQYSTVDCTDYKHLLSETFGQI